MAGFKVTTEVHISINLPYSAENTSGGGWPKSTKRKWPIGTDLAVEHRGVLPPILILIAAESISRSHGFGHAQIDSFEHIQGCPSMPIQVRKNEGLKGVVNRRRDLRRYDVVALGINQEHSCGRMERLQVLGFPACFALRVK